MKRGTALSHAKGYRLLDLLRTHLKLALSHTPPVPSPFPRSAKPACRLSRWPAAVERVYRVGASGAPQRTLLSLMSRLGKVSKG